MKYSKHKSVSFSDHKKYSDLAEDYPRTVLKMKKKSLKGAYYQIAIPRSG